MALLLIINATSFNQALLCL